MNKEQLSELNPPQPSLHDDALTTRGVTQTICVLFFVCFAIAVAGVIGLMLFKSLVEM